MLESMINYYYLFGDADGFFVYYVGCSAQEVLLSVLFCSG